MGRVCLGFESPLRPERLPHEPTQPDGQSGQHCQRPQKDRADDPHDHHLSPHAVPLRLRSVNPVEHRGLVAVCAVVDVFGWERIRGLSIELAERQLGGWLGSWDARRSVPAWGCGFLDTSDRSPWAIRACFS